MSEGAPRPAATVAPAHPDLHGARHTRPWRGARRRRRPARTSGGPRPGGAPRARGAAAGTSRADAFARRLRRRARGVRARP